MNRVFKLTLLAANTLLLTFSPVFAAEEGFETMRYKDLYKNDS